MAKNPTPQNPKTKESLPATADTSRSKPNDMIEALTNVILYKSQGHFRDELRNYITAPYDQMTPPEKVKKRPDGYDYVESSFMDFETKKFMPLYKYKLLKVNWEMGWINCIVSLKDRITGNTELGAGAARIQVSRGIEEPKFRDVIDMSNNVKAALTNAIKNAQSRFGISSDIYRRRESIPTEDERKRFELMKIQIYEINATRAKMFAEQWADLGTEWLEFLERWQVYIDRNTIKQESKKGK